MRKLAIVLASLAIVVGVCSQARAFTVTLSTKQIALTVVVTPSPIVYVPEQAVGLTHVAAPSPRVIADREAFDARVRSIQFLDSTLAYDPFSLGDMVAQTPPQGSVKVQFTVKLDPTYQYFHLIPKTSTLNAGYGGNTFTCAFEVFAYYPRTWYVTDDVYGSNTSGGTAGLNGFPTYNYPTASLLLWLAEGNTTSFAAYANGGVNQTSFTGAAGASKTVCIDLSLTVPNSVAAGSYPVTLNYTLSHS